MCDVAVAVAVAALTPQNILIYIYMNIARLSLKASYFPQGPQRDQTLQTPLANPFHFLGWGL